MKLVYESINEYVSHAENREADIRLDRWEQEQRGEKPLRNYIQQVIKLIWELVPDDIARQTGISEEIIDDLITAEEDQIITSNVYDMYNNFVEPEAAAMELGTQISNYIMGNI